MGAECADIKEISENSEKLKYSDAPDIACEVILTMSCCEGEDCAPLESVVSIDDRGQLVLPKELRDKWGIKGGDKLAIMSCIKGGKICCATMVKPELLTKNFQINIEYSPDEKQNKQHPKK
jgi:antitoxin PrlF